MDLTITQLEEHLSAMGHGVNLDAVKNKLYLYHRAAMKVLSKIDPDMTIREAQITNAVHNAIYDYSCATDQKGNKLIDIRPQVSRSESDRLTHRGGLTFDLKKAVRNNMFAVKYNKGERSLRIDTGISPAPTV